MLMSRAQTTEQPNTPSTDTTGKLNLLAWNIYLLPPLIARKGQKKRVPHIARILNNADYDVLVFNEAFHKKSRKRLAKQLRSKYPHQTRVLNRKRWIKSNGGVWILSRLPMTVLKEIRFSDCKAADCFSKKGAMLVEVEKGKQKFQILGTHLQADYVGKAFQTIRNKQYRQIKDELLTPFQKNKVPQLICGDLNTPKTDTVAYRSMLSVFEATDGKTSGDYTYISEDFANKKYPLKVQYDYILYKGNCEKMRHIERNIRAFRSEWKSGKFDLSDHYAIEAIFRW